jgi:hypothetical protein
MRLTTRMHSGFTIKLSRSACLGGLSAEDLRVVRDYKERNKNRDTLLEELDRKIRGDS